MALLLGVDTGGTYTDAVLIEDEDRVIAHAKALTTRHDLAAGVGNAIDAVLVESGADVADVAMVSLSTTLATNALVEGQGGRVGLIFIGFSERDLTRQGLEDALKGDPVIFVAGGHNHAGGEAIPLDEAALRAGLKEHGSSVSGFAVASQFATRNPEHETRTRDIIREVTGKPVSCSHDLSAKLNGPKRAMTALLNARLIGMIDHLISAVEGLLGSKSINAPFMVVRGDGALISADQARVSPIETILSGPAASIVGARWLTDEKDAIVSDIGGTTTDVAVLRDGRPIIDPQGARVGEFRTMVEAVAMRTTGLGGDSQVHMAKDGLAAALTLGPRRVMPVSLLAMDFPDLVHGMLDAQLGESIVGEYDGRFVRAIKRTDVSRDGLNDRETALLDRIGDTAHTMGSVLQNRMDQAALQILVNRGLVMMCGVTPSDASHVLGRLDVWDAKAAEKALQLFSRQRTGSGTRLAVTEQMLAQMIVDQLTEQTACALLETAFAEDGFDFGVSPQELARHVLVQKGMEGHRGLMFLDAGLNRPVIGLGASAHNYYGAVGERLSTKTILPKYAGVANAIGAVVGQISMRVSTQVTSQGEGRFRVHFETGPEDFASEENAFSSLEARLEAEALTGAKDAGAEGIRVRFDRDIKTAEVEGRKVFVEAEITAIASGRPRIALG
ncbi:hydantoinase/oxoprolinase family protein [Amylibacter sp. SFDW26]|uniref:hydantoinase/oxoprolinase N-terminal domain-containing protein n=1 Tax=Amylibacter sp. SFDW26 TaxID=2652722 RepID=UPI001261FD6B|nr:hydantoinase/oxoprolinase family protein [Amylibacter sp. SFDW26]KAB7613697.1 hydantoinase/oxoprolinase family protein [Amylibacter sp. SFDW26]